MLFFVNLQQTFTESKLSEYKGFGDNFFKTDDGSEDVNTE